MPKGVGKIFGKEWGMRRKCCVSGEWVAWDEEV